MSNIQADLNPLQPLIFEDVPVNEQATSTDGSILRKKAIYTMQYRAPGMLNADGQPNDQPVPFYISLSTFGNVSPEALEAFDKELQMLAYVEIKANDPIPGPPLSAEGQATADTSLGDMPLVIIDVSVDDALHLLIDSQRLHILIDPSVDHKVAHQYRFASIQGEFKVEARQGKVNVKHSAKAPQLVREKDSFQIAANDHLTIWAESDRIISKYLIDGPGLRLLKDDSIELRNGGNGVVISTPTM
jgi:hypothetical protein